MRLLARISYALAVGAALALPPSHAQAANDLEAIRQAKVVRVGAVSAPPWYSKDLTTNLWGGLVPDVLDKLFEGTGIRIEYVDTQWGTAVAGLQSHRFDLLGAYNETPERAKAIDFTRPIGSLKSAILTSQADAGKYASWETINTPSIRLSAIDGAGATVLLRPVLPKTTWIFQQSSDSMYMDLESGRADAILTSDVQISMYLSQRRRGTMVIPEPVYSQPTNIAVRKSADPALRAWLDESLQRLQADGTLDAIWAKYVRQPGK